MMKVFRSCLILISLASVGLVNAQESRCPNGIKPRYEWRDLPSTEIDKFLSAIQKLHTSGDGYNRLSRKHYNNYRQWHQGGYLFPVHRRLLLEFEEAIRAIDPTVTIPYWCWSLSSQNPSQDPIWERFSRDGDNVPVTDGILGNKNVSVPQSHQLQRGITSDGPPRQIEVRGVMHDTFTSLQMLTSIAQNTNDYDEFRGMIEYGAHYYVHAGVGGKTGDFGTMISVNDPLFFLHHAYVDKLWWDWQNMKSDRKTKISGETSYGSMIQVKPSDTMPGYSEKVSDMFDIEESCYTYMPPGSQFKPTTTSTLTTVQQTTLSSTSFMSSATAVSTTSSVTVQSPSASPSSSRMVSSTASGSQQKSTTTSPMSKAKSSISTTQPTQKSLVTSVTSSGKPSTTQSPSKPFETATNQYVPVSGYSSGDQYVANQTSPSKAQEAFNNQTYHVGSPGHKQAYNSTSVHQVLADTKTPKWIEQSRMVHVPQIGQVAQVYDAVKKVVSNPATYGSIENFDLSKIMQQAKQKSLLPPQKCRQRNEVESSHNESGNGTVASEKAVSTTPDVQPSQSEDSKVSAHSGSVKQLILSVKMVLPALLMCLF